MCAGAIDGTHIPIIAPVVDHADDVNRRGYHSIVMQAIVDSRYLFGDIVVGWLDSVHDTRISFNSGLYKTGNEGSLFSSDITTTTDATDVRDALAQYFALEVPHVRRGHAARV